MNCTFRDSVVMVNDKLMVKLRARGPHKYRSTRCVCACVCMCVADIATVGVLEHFYNLPFIISLSHCLRPSLLLLFPLSSFNHFLLNPLPAFLTHSFPPTLFHFSALPHSSLCLSSPADRAIMLSLHFRMSA